MGKNNLWWELGGGGGRRGNREFSLVNVKFEMLVKYLNEDITWVVDMYLVFRGEVKNGEICYIF